MCPCMQPPHAIDTRLLKLGVSGQVYVLVGSHARSRRTSIASGHAYHTLMNPRGLVSSARSLTAISCRSGTRDVGEFDHVYTSDVRVLVPRPRSLEGLGDCGSDYVWSMLYVCKRRPRALGRPRDLMHFDGTEKFVRFGYLR